METANNAPVLKSFLPVIVIYASVAKTEKSPPIIIGLPKSSSDLINVNSNELNTAGIASGKVTVENTFHLEAPKLKAESSNEASIVSSTPFKLRYAIGEKDIACIINKLLKPNTSVLCMPNTSLEINPELPKRRIMANASTKGGETTGNTATKLKNFLPNMLVLVTE